jgi:hypothetical protein
MIISKKTAILTTMNYIPVHKQQLSISTFRFQSTEPSQPDPAVVTSTHTTAAAVRRRSIPSARQRSTSSLWVPSICPSSICVHYNAVDRGLCAQTLREHHTVLKRAIGGVFPRFKWGKSHYLQVILHFTRPST